MESLDRAETLISGPASSEPSLNDDEYDEEEEDVDFNPFLKDPPSREPSSSLSSEIEPTDSEIAVTSITAERKSPHKDGDVVRGKGNSTMEANVKGEQSCQVIRPPKQVLLLPEEEDDAICKRTRARYSLESFTLDDLEAFLQETDDEEDIPNVDDEEEYRKFLAAVLHSGDGEAPLVESGNNDDDDDEDNDLDFEIELEEALETDDDEIIPEKVTTHDNKTTKRRPITRQKRQQSISTQRNINSSDQPSRSLRPLVPILPIQDSLMRFPPIEAVPISEDKPMLGFTQAQMGELHSLMHDHLQLLIQVYSLCALDHSRQHIGTQVQGLISEMTQRQQQHVSRPTHLLSTASVSDVVGLAGKYLVDVSSAVQDYRRCQVESGYDALSQRVPLFPLPHQEAGSEIVVHSPSSPSTNKLPSDQQQSKKTLAAKLAESAKKQSVALVHKDIAKLAKTFLPYFKESLYPHKPPVAAVINRFLFTEAEDELLALGIMEYNSDWKAIQQRFLPCKGEHQIYVRQKNRRSSKAPENPIKAVLRMKSSPLTPQEIERIQEGLKYFKHDWTSVWKFIVPYRDPSLLPRQWRIALGIQKSYKLDAAKKEKRRLYDTKRKSREQLVLAKEDRHGASTANKNPVGDELVDNPGAYLHEGFLADWRPGMPRHFYSTSIQSVDKAKDVPRDRHESVQTCTSEGFRQPQLCGAQTLTSTRRLGASFFPVYHHPSWTAPGASRAPISLQPHRTRKQYNKSVVRLAPDLPPVDLPSSVRVISQSVFAKNQPETSTKNCIIKVNMSDISGKGNLVTEPSCSSAEGDNNGSPSEKMINLPEDVPAESSSAMGETNNDSDLQMHPLLFRTPEDGQNTCYPSNKDPRGGSSFSFFSDKQPQLLSLFNSPRQINHSADQFQEKSSLNEQEAAQGSSCFHPLLQRTDCETSYHTSRCGNLDPDTGKKSKLCQLKDTSGAVKKTSTPNAGCNDVSLKPLSKHAKNVNLDIYLSSGTPKVNNSGSVSAPNISEVSEICIIQRDDGSELPGSTPPSDDVSRGMDEMADQSNLGIVMEQEELSDSDEEMMEEEHVEFECEEMADSEGEEGSECEEIIETQDKDNRSSAVDVDSGKELGRDSPNSPWLSLDSRSRRLGGKIKLTGKREPANRTAVVQCGPSRSRRKRTPVKSRDEEAKADAVVGLLRLPLMKKPRKCMGQAERSPSLETT